MAGPLEIKSTKPFRGIVTACSVWSAEERRGTVTGLKTCFRSRGACFRIECKSMKYSDIITIEPGKRGGKPCIRGLRVTAYDVPYLPAE